MRNLHWSTGRGAFLWPYFASSRLHWLAVGMDDPIIITHCNWIFLAAGEGQQWGNKVTIQVWIPLDQRWLLLIFPPLWSLHQRNTGFPSNHTMALLMQRQWILARFRWFSIQICSGCESAYSGVLWKFCIELVNTLVRLASARIFVSSIAAKGPFTKCK